MKKIKWVILLAAFLLGTFANAFAYSGTPLFTFNVPVNLVNIPGSLGPLAIVVTLLDKNDVLITRYYTQPPELNVSSGIINFNKTVTVSFVAVQLDGHNPEEVVSYRAAICRAPYGKMLADLMAAGGPTPYDASKPFIPGTASLPIH